MHGLVLQVNVSLGGLPKRPIAEAFLTPLGFEGDAVGHPAIHGGPQQAVLLVTAETTDELIAEGFPLFYGALGENLTTRGLDRRELRLGMRLRAGEAVIELTRLRAPCTALDVYGPRLRERILGKDAQTGEADWALGGFYASVAVPGRVWTGASIRVLDAAV
jgi:MOSC domain-containing protein YiiM